MQIGPAIAQGFLTGTDTQKPVWKRIKQEAPPHIINELRYIPNRLADEGKALTWSMMHPHFSAEGKSFHKDFRDALQHVYFQEYCREFKLIALSDIPFLMDVFYLPVERQAYSFRRLKEFLSCIDSVELFLGASADFIVNMRRRPGFVELMDAYVGIALDSKSDSELKYRVAIARRSSKFDWGKLASRRRGTIGDPSDLEALEIAHGCAELAGILTNTYGLSTRLAGAAPADMLGIATLRGTAKLKITIFVALEEELRVLAKQLSLHRNVTPPAATGRIGNVELDVLCPRKMGRVPAAVAVARYLSNTKPDLILCIGLAGGFVEAKIDPGTVICANKVVDLAYRKITDDAAGGATAKFRQEDFDCSTSFYSVATSHQFDRNAWENHCRDNFDWPDGRVPSLREGKIASVDEVLSSDDHRAKMLAVVDKLLGVEMEAGGVCEAAKAYGIPVAVLRVVSDLADPSKADDAWRARGMKSLAELLNRIPLKEVIDAAQNR